MTIEEERAVMKKGADDATCVVEVLPSRSVGFVEFFDSPQSPQSRQGFALGHLLHYRLAASPSQVGAATAEAPPQVLTLAFSTADVVITGWRLERIAESIGEGRLAAVKTIPHRHAGLTGARPAVVAIEIRPVSSNSSSG